MAIDISVVKSVTSAYPSIHGKLGKDYYQSEPQFGANLVKFVTSALVKIITSQINFRSPATWQKIYIYFWF